MKLTIITTIMTSMTLSYAQAARAAGGNCPSTPQPYDTSGCSSFCARDAADPSILVCDITAQPGNNDVVVVKNYRSILIAGTERYSAWGTANGVNFCCTEDSTANNPVNGVEVFTGSGADEVWFTAFNNGVERNLTSNSHQTVANRFTGFVYPGGGADRVEGSNSKASDYLDYLTGEDGADIIHGNKGPDFISVSETRNAGFYSTGNNGESVYGDNGRDEIVGATNNIVATDTIFVSGGNQNDLLCTGPVGFLTAQKVYFFGGNGDDEIYSRSSFVAGNDGPLYGDAGNDGCDNPGGGTEFTCERAYNASNFTAWAPIICN